MKNFHSTKHTFETLNDPDTFPKNVAKPFLYFTIIDNFTSYISLSLTGTTYGMFSTSCFQTYFNTSHQNLFT